MLQFWMRYDLRSPSIGRSSVEMVSAAIEQVEWADKRGFHSVQLTEHHGTPDNVNPSPLIIAAAMASRTSEIRLQPAAIILPLHDPVRIAEDCIMVDIISNGRLDVTVGLGYMPHEFEMFGVEMAVRGRLMNEKLEVLRRCFSGEAFEYDGRKVHVTPQPVQERGPKLFIGGDAHAAVPRAAEYGDAYYPMTLRSDFIEEYHRLCAECGKPGRVIDGNGPTVLHIAEDPDADWARLSKYAFYEVCSYAANAKKAGQPLPYEGVNTTDDLRKSGMYRVLTPDEGLAYCREQRDLGRYVALNPLVSGIDPDVSWRSLELIADRIIPELRQDELAHAESPLHTA